MKKLIRIGFVICLFITASLLVPTTANAMKTVSQTKKVSVYKKTSTKLYVKWKKVSKASGYNVRVYLGKKLKKSYIVKGGSKTKKTVTGLYASTKYTVKIRAYRLSGRKKVYGKFSNKTYAKTNKPSKPTLTKIQVLSSSKIKATWKKLSGITGYVVYLYDGSKLKKKITLSKTKISTTFSPLKPNTTYKVRMKSYVKVGNKKYYSAYSKTLTTTTKKPEPTTQQPTTQQPTTVDPNKMITVTLISNDYSLYIVSTDSDVYKYSKTVKASQVGKMMRDVRTEDVFSCWSTKNGEGGETYVSAADDSYYQFSSNITLYARYFKKGVPQLDKDLLPELNRLRKQYGLAPAVWGSALEAGTLIRAKELATDDGHKRPDGSDCVTAWDPNAQLTECTAYIGKNLNFAIDTWCEDAAHKGALLTTGSKVYVCFGIYNGFVEYAVCNAGQYESLLDVLGKKK